MKIQQELRDALHAGMVIPAHPLALNARRQLDEARQTALSRYYLAAGAGGLAVGVHTTQFAIRDPQYSLLRRVLELGAVAVKEHVETTGDPRLLVAGLCGKTVQAAAEAELAAEVGYHAGLLSLAAFQDADDQEMLQHVRQLAKIIPIFGFYLQPAVGGRVLPYSFWREFVEIEGVLAIKIAAFNRYQTMDVIRAVHDSGRQEHVALYTGNDDNIVVDLVTQYDFSDSSNSAPISFSGGLLGHWACWTRAAVQLLERCKRAKASPETSDWVELLRLANQVTDMNAAIFDAANDYRGCIAGIHEVLRRQQLLEGNWCLDENETCSPGQVEEISRVCRSYPHLIDDSFVESGLASWM